MELGDAGKMCGAAAWASKGLGHFVPSHQLVVIHASLATLVEIYTRHSSARIGTEQRNFSYSYPKRLFGFCARTTRYSSSYSYALLDFILVFYSYKVSRLDVKLVQYRAICKDP